MLITADIVDRGIPLRNPNPPDPIMRAEFPREVGRRGWQEAVSSYFRNVGGWLQYHTYDSTHSPKGFPDLVLVHTTVPRVLFAELKSETGEVTPEQEEWLRRLARSGNEVYLWRPSDRDEIQDIIQTVHEQAFQLRERGLVVPTG